MGKQGGIDLSLDIIENVQGSTWLRTGMMTFFPLTSNRLGSELSFFPFLIYTNSFSLDIIVVGVLDLIAFVGGSGLL